MSRRVDSAMTANTSSVTMPSTLATYTPKGINYFGLYPNAIALEPFRGARTVPGLPRVSGQRPA